MKRYIPFFLSCMVCLVVLNCCSNYGGHRTSFNLPFFSNDPLYGISKLESEILKHGTVSVGGIRMAQYSSGKEAREQLKGRLKSIFCKYSTLSNTDPQTVSTDLIATYFSAAASILKGAPMQNGNNKENVDNNLNQKVLESAFKNFSEAIKNTKTNLPLTDRIRLNMAAMKYIQLEMEELSLDKYYPVDRANNFKRMTLSLDLTAWVTRKARAVLVYVDLYPLHADSWCHDAAKIVFCNISSAAGSKKSKETSGDCKKHPLSSWDQKVSKRILDKIYKSSSSDAAIFKTYSAYVKAVGCDRSDAAGTCHYALIIGNMLPIIKGIERMDEAEYVVSNQGAYNSSAFGLNSMFPALNNVFKIGLDAKYGREKIDALSNADLLPTNVAFLAGDRRAGWLFMPSVLEKMRMHPIERHLKIIVDVPESLQKMGVTVHKIFLDENLQKVSGDDFSKQMQYLNITRFLLDDVEDAKDAKENKKDSWSLNANPVNWRIIKSRVRNTLYQGLPEELVVDVP